VAAERWRGLRMTEFERRQLTAIRNELDRAHAERTAPVAALYPARLGLDRRWRRSRVQNMTVMVQKIALASTVSFTVSATAE
jgi:hypothetical protein